MYIGNKNVYRIPLMFIVNLSLVNQPVKVDLKIICTLETKGSKVLESNKQKMALPKTD